MAQKDIPQQTMTVIRSLYVDNKIMIETGRRDDKQQQLRKE